MILYNQQTKLIVYENKPESRVFFGEKNESFFCTYTETYVEADLEEYLFYKYVETSGLDFNAVGHEGFDIRCFGFNNIHVSQKDEFMNRKNESENWYIHHISDGFYCIESTKEDRAAWTTAYDKNNKRIYRYRYDKW